METHTLLRDFAIVMATAGVALVLFRRIKQPPILGYLLAGVLIGPFTLPHPPVENVETIRLLADLGLVVLLFALGIEFGWQRIREIGPRVVFIGGLGISLMIWLGYQTGLALGWTSTEAFFLGAALSISSTAVLIQVLRESGKLHGTAGRLIIGILIIEDFAAVILLSVLSGIASADSTGVGDVGVLVLKLFGFAAAALVLGALFVPRILSLVRGFRSAETLLITSLGFCFGAALLAEEMGLSGAAGAFLIGTVIGDSEHSEAIEHMMSPIRDMFAALFFVSIGMLVNFTQVSDFLVPTIVVTTVFISGKVIVHVIGTFLTGHDGRTSLQVGAGMPQLGEFSLAMVKVGADRGVIGPALYPVTALTALITAFLYPFIFRGSDRVAGLLERHAPVMLKEYVNGLTHTLSLLQRTGGSRPGATTESVRRSARVILINIAIIALLIAVGTVTLRFAAEITEPIGISEGLLGLIVAATIITLAIPSGIVVWRTMSLLAEELTKQVFWRHADLSDGSRTLAFTRVVEQTLLGIALMLLAIWALPLVLELLSIGNLAAPLPILIMVITIAITARAAIKIHSALEATFSKTFLGQSSPRADGTRFDGQDAPGDRSSRGHDD